MGFVLTTGEFVGREVEMFGERELFGKGEAHIERKKVFGQWWEGSFCQKRISLAKGDPF